MEIVKRNTYAIDFIEAMNLEREYNNYIEKRIEDEEDENGAYGLDREYDNGYTEYDERKEELYEDSWAQYEFIEDMDLVRKYEIWAVIALGVSVK